MSDQPPIVELSISQAVYEHEDAIVFDGSHIPAVAQSLEAFIILYLTQEDEQNGYGTVIQLDSQTKQAAIFADLNPEYTYLFFKDEQGQLQTLLWCIEFATRTPDGLYITHAKVHGKGVTQEDMERFSKIPMPNTAQPSPQSQHPLTESYTTQPAPTQPAPAVDPNLAAMFQNEGSVPNAASSTSNPTPTPNYQPLTTTTQPPAVNQPLATQSPAAPQSFQPSAFNLPPSEPALPADPTPEPELSLPPLPPMPNAPANPSPMPTAQLTAGPSPIPAPPVPSASIQAPLPPNPTPAPTTTPFSQPIQPTGQTVIPSAAQAPASPTPPPLPEPDLSLLGQTIQEAGMDTQSAQAVPSAPIPSSPSTLQPSIPNPAPETRNPEPASRNPVGRPPKPLIQDQLWMVEPADFTWIKSISREPIGPNQHTIREKLTQQMRKYHPGLVEDWHFQAAFDQAFAAVCLTYDLVPSLRHDLLKALFNGRIVENVYKNMPKQG